MPRVAAVQVEASHLDPEAGLERIGELAARAAADGAEVVVFPELLVPGYPRYIPDPFPQSEEGSKAWEEAVRYHREYVEASQVVPGPFTEQLGEIAREVGATLVVGVSERDPQVRGRLWNTGVVVDDSGPLPRPPPQAGRGDARAADLRPRRGRGHPHLRGAAGQHRRLHLLREPPAALPAGAGTARRGDPLRALDRSGAARAGGRRVAAREARGARDRPRPRHRHLRRHLQPGHRGRAGGRREGAAVEPQRRQLHHRPARQHRRPGARLGGGDRDRRPRPRPDRRGAAGLEPPRRRHARRPLRRLRAPGAGGERGERQRRADLPHRRGPGRLGLARPRGLDRAGLRADRRGGARRRRDRRPAGELHPRLPLLAVRDEAGRGGAAPPPAPRRSGRDPRADDRGARAGGDRGRGDGGGRGHRARPGPGRDALQHQRRARPRGLPRQAPQARPDLGRAGRLGRRRRLDPRRLPDPAGPARDPQLRRERQHPGALRAAQRGRARPRRQLPLLRAARRPPHQHQRRLPAGRRPRLRGAALQRRRPGVRHAGGLRADRGRVRPERLELHLGDDRPRRQLDRRR